jgi:hypothetical protein
LQLWAVTAGLVLFGLFIAWASGLFEERAKDAPIVEDGAIVLDNLPENAVVAVDGEDRSFGRLGGKPATIRLRPGKHGVMVKTDGVILLGENVMLEPGKETKLSVKLDQLAATRRENDRSTSPAPPGEARTTDPSDHANAPAVSPTPSVNEPVNHPSKSSIARANRAEPVAAKPPVHPVDTRSPRLGQNPPGFSESQFLGNEPPLPSAAHDPSHLEFDRGRPILVASRCVTPPAADGIVHAGEYGDAQFVDFTFTPNSRFGGIEGAAIKGKSPEDLSIRLRVAYSSKSLFLAVQVRDQFVDDQQTAPTVPQWNDGIEIFIDGDRVANDFHLQKGRSSSEGFQLLANVAGHRFTASHDFKNDDWKSASRRYREGYVIEVEIPLALIDVKDGPQRISAGPGSTINFALALTDNDTAVNDQTTYAFIRANPAVRQPIAGGEGSWSFGIKLERFSLGMNR